VPAHKYENEMTVYSHITAMANRHLQGQPRGVAPTVTPFCDNSVTNVTRHRQKISILYPNMTNIGKTTFNARACGASSLNVFSTSHSQLTTSQSSRINPLSCCPPPPPPPPPIVRYGIYLYWAYSIRPYKNFTIQTFKMEVTQ